MVVSKIRAGWGEIAGWERSRKGIIVFSARTISKENFFSTKNKKYEELILLWDAAYSSVIFAEHPIRHYF